MSQLNSLPWTSNPEGTQSVQPGEIVADCKQRPCRLAGGQHTLHLLQSLEPQIISLQNARSFILFQKKIEMVLQIYQSQHINQRKTR